MSGGRGLPGSAGLMLAPGVAFLEPEPAVFEAMLDGWAVQQSARFLKPTTIRQRLELVRRLGVFTNAYPWQWDAAEVEAYFAELRSRQRPIGASTARIYQHTLRLFLEYVTDPRYGWAAECRERFGAAPVQVLHE